MRLELIRADEPLRPPYDLRLEQKLLLARDVRWHGLPYPAPIPAQSILPRAVHHRAEWKPRPRSFRPLNDPYGALHSTT